MFGDLPLAVEISTPTLPECEPWPLIVQLDHEKEVTGMFLSGHPLDHYKFEMKHYGITPLQSSMNSKKRCPFTKFKQDVQVGWAGCRLRDIKFREKEINMDHFIIEDYSGKTELVLWGDDYVKFTPFLQPGIIIVYYGFFKQRFNKPEFEFKVNGITTGETIKRNLTKQLTIEVHPKDISKDVIEFIEGNMKKFPGRTHIET